MSTPFQQFRQIGKDLLPTHQKLLTFRTCMKVELEGESAASVVEIG